MEFNVPSAALGRIRTIGIRLRVDWARLLDRQKPASFHVRYLETFTGLSQTEPIQTRTTTSEEKINKMKGEKVARCVDAFFFFFLSSLGAQLIQYIYPVEPSP